jgi:hypothetical protein
MKILILFLVLIISDVFAHDWVRSQDRFNFLTQQLIFSNRSYCANQGNKPTQSVLLLVDNVNVARAAFRLAKIKNLDALPLTNKVVENFRFALTGLINEIATRLLNGSLPYLEDSRPTHQQLEANWNQSKLSSSSQRMRCQRIKKITSLLSPHYVSKPDHLMLETMAKDLEDLDQIYGSCEEKELGHSPEVALYQFDVLADHSFYFIGYKFWHSLKNYLSWAYRFSAEFNALAHPFGFLLSSANLEEMVLLLSNGCGSISRPECSQNELNLNSLSVLTRPAGDFDFFNSPRVKPLPSDLTEDLLNSRLPLKEDDLLHLTKFSESHTWVKNFRENFTKARGLQKMRLTQSLGILSLLSQSLTSELMNKQLLVESEIGGGQWQEQFFYLCSEYSAASNARLVQLERDLMLLENQDDFTSLIKDLGFNPISESVQLFTSVSLNVKNLCQKLEDKKFWDQTVINRSGFSLWYQQLHSLEAPQKITSTLSPPKSPSPFLALKNGGTLCQTALHCSRIILESLIHLSAVSRFTSTIYSNEILSSNTSNPYSSQVACGVYDPWAKRNKIVFDFFHSVAQSAVFGLLPTPVYVSLGLVSKKAISFSTLIKEGKVFYDPAFSKTKLKASLMADLGPLASIPCAISVSNSAINPLMYYAFNGISFSQCSQRDRNEIRVSTDQQIETHHSQRSFCTTCAINLQTISSSVAQTHPALRVSFFLAKGIVQLVKNLKDPQDLPRSWSLDPIDLTLSYRYWGKINRACGRRILKNTSCLPTNCERKVMKTLVSEYDISPVSSTFSCASKSATLAIKECDRPLTISFLSQIKIDSPCILKER